MCRNIKQLYNFDPPATHHEIRAAAEQFVRKISGFHQPSQANQPAFEAAIDAVAEASQRLITELVTTATPLNREEEAAKARERSIKRFGLSA